VTRRSRLRALAAGAMLVLGGATRAAAQEVSPLEPPDLTRYLRWGAFRVRPAILVPTLGYDSNVYYRPVNSTVPPVGDYFANVSPSVEGTVLFGTRAFLTFDERLEFYLYAHEPVNYFNQLGKARLTVPFAARWVLYGDIGYDRTRDRPIEAQDQRPIRIDRPLGIGAIVRFGWRTDAEFGVTRTRSTASDPDEQLTCIPGVDPGCFSTGDLNDRTETGTRVLARYLLFGRTRLVVEMQRSDIVFDNPQVLRDGHERRILPGMDFGLGGRISGTFHVGYARFDLGRAGAEGFEGAVGDAALGYQLGGLGSYLTLTGTRDVRYSINETSDLFRYAELTLTFVKYFNRLIGLEASSGHGRVVYLGDPNNRTDAILQGSLGVRLRLSETEIGRRVEYAFRYTLTRRNASCVIAVAPFNCDEFDQNRGTVGFGLVYGY